MFKSNYLDLISEKRQYHFFKQNPIYYSKNKFLILSFRGLTTVLYWWYWDMKLINVNFMRYNWSKFMINTLINSFIHLIHFLRFSFNHFDYFSCLSIIFENKRTIEKKFSYNIHQSRHCIESCLLPNKKF